VGSARGVQIDIDLGRLSIRYPMEVNLAGDSAETLRNLPPLPPHITPDPARKFTSMLVQGDPDEGNLLIGTAKQALDSVLPGRD
jgi:thiamine pyrophosphate-dependent acetolactate synthase large subunit-like protein